MGTPDYAAIILEALLDTYGNNIVGVVMQSDKEVGRGRKIVPPSTKSLLIQRGFKGAIMQPHSLKDGAFMQQMVALCPSIIIVAAYGKILPQEVLQLAPCYNLHASLLPKYRGASPIQEAILSGDMFIGVTLMAMEKGLDCGAYLAKSIVLLDKNDNSSTLFIVLAKLAADLLLSSLSRIHSLKPIAQIDTDASYCHKIKKTEGLIVFDNALNVERKIRAYAYYPGTFLESGLKIKNAQLYDEYNHYHEGEILKIDKKGIVVGCHTGSLLITCVQAPHKKEMNAIDYIHGKRLKYGDILF